MRPLVCLLIVALVSGCITRGAFPIQLRSDLTREELEPYAELGDRSVVGQAVWRIEEGGFVVTCAGLDAVLLPDIPVVQEAIKIWRDGEPIYTTNLEEPNVNRAVRFSRCDADGNFVFHDLPPLSYWLIAKVTWEFGEGEYGGYLARRIRLQDGSALRIVLSGDDERDTLNPTQGEYEYIRPWRLWNKLTS